MTEHDIQTRGPALATTTMGTWCPTWCPPSLSHPTATDHFFRTLLKRGRGQHRKFLPYAFTEQGVAML